MKKILLYSFLVLLMVGLVSAVECDADLNTTPCEVSSSLTLNVGVYNCSGSITINTAGVVFDGNGATIRGAEISVSANDVSIINTNIIGDGIITNGVSFTGNNVFFDNNNITGSFTECFFRMNSGENLTLSNNNFTGETAVTWCGVGASFTGNLLMHDNIIEKSTGLYSLGWLNGNLDSGLIYDNTFIGTGSFGDTYADNSLFYFTTTNTEVYNNTFVDMLSFVQTTDTAICKGTSGNTYTNGGLAVDVDFTFDNACSYDIDRGLSLFEYAENKIIDLNGITLNTINSGINILALGVTIDGNGATINGSGSGTAISLISNGVIIKDLNIQNFEQGIYSYIAVNNLIVKNSYFKDLLDASVNLRDLGDVGLFQNISIINNTFENSYGGVIILGNGDNIFVENNTFMSITDRSVWLAGALDGYYTGSINNARLVNNDLTGITQFDNVTNLLVIDNYGDGMMSAGGDNITIYNNYFLRMIWLDVESDGDVYNNVFNFSILGGLYDVFWYNAGRFYNNTVIDMPIVFQDGIRGGVRDICNGGISNNYVGETTFSAVNNIVFDSACDYSNISLKFPYDWVSAGLIIDGSDATFKSINLEYAPSFTVKNMVVNEDVVVSATNIGLFDVDVYGVLLVNNSGFLGVGNTFRSTVSDLVVGSKFCDYNSLSENFFVGGVYSGVNVGFCAKTTNFDGDTTDFSVISDWSSVDLVLENVNGKIDWVSGKDLSGTSVDFDSFVIIEQDKIGVDSSGYPELNASASLVFKNVNALNQNVIVVYSNKILNFLCRLGIICLNNDYDSVAKIYSMDVTSFSTYELDYDVSLEEVDTMNIFWDVALKVLVGFGILAGVVGLYIGVVAGVNVSRGKVWNDKMFKK